MVRGMADELFRSDDLLVRRVGGHGDACCVVTFDNFTDFRTLERNGFGEAFLDSSGIDAIHVIPRDNLWYQHPETVEAMARVREATRGYRRVVTYGSSMGAYAAVRLAGLVGADAVLALSPQFSIDPAIVPWEERYLICAEQFQDVWEKTLPYPEIAEAYVGYDPMHGPDTRHVELLAERFRFTRLRLPKAGHPVTGFLVEIGVLQDSMRALCRGTFDAEAMLAEAHRLREESSQYLVNLADDTVYWRRGRRLTLLHKAVRLAPNNALLLARLGAELRYAGRFEESLAMYRRSVEKQPRHPSILTHYSLALQRMGDVMGALAVMEDVYALTEGAALYRERVELLRGMMAGGGGPRAGVRRRGWFRRLADWMGGFGVDAERAEREGRR